MVGIIFLWILTFFTVLIIGIASLSSSPTTVKSNSVLELNLNGAIQERTMDNPFEKFMDKTNEQTMGLNRILTAIKNAETDNNIKGISLYVNNINASYASIEELRNALIHFKKSGKFIYTYAESMSQNAYYLATASDSIFVHPEGSIILNGLSAEVIFIHQLLDKLEIEPQIVRHGEFKSAVEIFILDKMSNANKEQMQEFVTSTWEHICSNISNSRNISNEKINRIADSLLLLFDTKLAVNEHFIDGLKYKDEYESLLKKKLQVEETRNFNKISLFEYLKTLKPQKSSPNQIAVIYAAGDIIEKEGDYENIGYGIAEEIKDARQDKAVKAIVLRVNSGGGSALMSDVIWREVTLTKKVKPIIVSMGDFAASGGYYISCAADYIVAQPTTITGSIGVFGVIPNIQNFLSHKLGITTDIVKTNIHSDAISITRPMSNYEKIVLQKSIEKVYNTFLQHVSDGRNMSVAEVDSIAQGRIWTGIDAMKIGLVDTLGGLDLAIQIAAKKAAVKNYTLSERPIIKDFFEEFASSLMETKLSKKMNTMKNEKIYQYYTYIETLNHINGIQARIPFLINIQ